MELNFYPYTIKLKERFTISIHSRQTTPAVMVELKHQDLIGYGEASLPPYLEEDQSSVIHFLDKLNLSQFKDPLQLDLILDYINDTDSGNYAAKAAIDIALHDLAGKILNIPVHEYLNISKKKELYSSYTFGILDPSVVRAKIESTKEFRFLKIKLGTENDKEIIKTIRTLTSVPLFIDVNQGWKNKHYALDMINWLAEQNVIFIEQPLVKENFKDTKWLQEQSPLPIIADEDFKRLEDLEKIVGIYSGVNIKLMKAGGIRSAFQIIKKARELNFKIMLGCMTETSCAITAASHLSSLVDWIDLDGALLISNDLFSGMKVKNGRIIIPETPGLGIEKSQQYE